MEHASPVLTFVVFIGVLIGEITCDIDVVRIRAAYGTNQELVVNSSVEYLIEYYQNPDAEENVNPGRIRLFSEDANVYQPVLVSARFSDGAAMWQVPHVVTSRGQVVTHYSLIERTLCPHNNVMRPENDTLACDDASLRSTIVHVSTTCVTNIKIDVMVYTTYDFYVAMDRTYTVEVAPNTPTYFFYSFEYGPVASNVDLSGVRALWRQKCDKEMTHEDVIDAKLAKDVLANTVIPPRVRIVANSDSDICATVSIQNYSCPVFDSEREILYEGLYMTMTQNSSVQLASYKFPYGFYIVFIIRESDELCTGEPDAEEEDLFDILVLDRGTNVKSSKSTSRTKTISFRIEATISYGQYVVGTAAAFSFFLAFYLVFGIIILVLRTPYAKRLFAKDRNEMPPRDSRGVDDGALSGSDSDSDDSAMTRDTGVSVEMPRRLHVAQLSKRRARAIRARSQRYLWTIITVAVFYSLPVIQLVATYQNVLNISGDQDLCYYNFMCAHPLGIVSDYNHLISNIGYVLLGTLFVIQVARRERRQKYRVDIQEFGLPPQYGLLYALGVGLIVEGVLSGSYHLCPNQMNFQFDTAFMYVISVICMMKIYQTRHPDLTARSHSTFGVLALIIALGVYGVLRNTPVFWATFTTLHVLTFFFLSLQIYYVGQFTKISELPIVEAARSVRTAGTRQFVDAATPRYKPRLIMLILANCANWAYAGYGLWTQGDNFASHLLMLLLANLAIYTIFYIVMKLIHRERIIPHAWLFIIIAFLSWPPALYFFIVGVSDWSTTPALSRTRNQDCDILSFYDAHDIWHFLSAIAMFSSFNMLLTWDDGLSSTPRHLINVF